MNAYRLPAYIVMEIPSPVSEAIQAIRDSLATPTSRLPVEITVAGSSGIGPVPPGSEKNDTERGLKSVLSDLRPFPAQFQEIRRFPNTNIFYLAPQERARFDRIHDLLKASGISFGSNPWPYNPHCTLRGGPMTDRFSAEDIFSLSFPKQEFIIDTLSIYEFDPQTVTCHLTFQTKI
jgi:2'-5' RNA ligase